jgi:hypothetical protein
LSRKDSCHLDHGRSLGFADTSSRAQFHSFLRHAVLIIHRVGRLRNGHKSGVADEWHQAFPGVRSRRKSGSAAAIRTRITCSTDFAIVQTTEPVHVPRGWRPCKSGDWRKPSRWPEIVSNNWLLPRVQHGFRHISNLRRRGSRATSEDGRSSRASSRPEPCQCQYSFAAAAGPRSCFGDKSMGVPN